MVVVVPKRTTHCPVCGLAITLDASIRIRPAPGTVAKGQGKLDDDQADAVAQKVAQDG
jgi:hypothetical protein